MAEIWRGVIYQGKNYSDRVEVSNTGKLRNAKTKKEYKMQIGKAGYYQTVISLGSRAKKKMFKLHRAVAETFIPNPKALKVINHRDLNKLNNNISNLEWCTQKDNMIHASQNNALKSKHAGTEAVFSKLSEEDVIYIRGNYIPNDNLFGCRALARKYNVSHSVIYNVLKRNTYKEIA